MKLFCDSKSVSSNAHNLVQHDTTKHVEIDRHFIEEKLDIGLMTTTNIPYGYQLANVPTKDLPT